MYNGFLVCFVFTFIPNVFFFFFAFIDFFSLQSMLRVSVYLFLLDVFIFM